MSNCKDKPQSGYSVVIFDLDGCCLKRDYPQLETALASASIYAQFFPEVAVRSLAEPAVVWAGGLSYV